MKKILSLILVLTMIIGMLPQIAYASVVVPPPSRDYMFCLYENGGHSDITLSSTSYKIEKYNNNKTFTNYNEGAERFWGYLGTNATTGYNKGYFVGINTSLCVKAVANEWVALKIQLPAAGTYEITGSALHDKNANSDMQIYIAPMTSALADTFADAATYGTVSSQKNADGSDNSKVPQVRDGAKAFSELGISENDKVGSVNIYQTTSEVKAFDNTDLRPFTTTSGYTEYVLLFKAGNASGNLTPTSLSFKLTEPLSTLQDVSLTLAEETVREGKTVRSSFTVTDTSGSPYGGGYAVEYEISDPSIAEIDEATGIVTAKKEGSTDITIKVTADSSAEPKTDTVHLTVSAPKKVGTYSYDFTTNALLPSSGLVNPVEDKVASYNLTNITPENLNSQTDSYAIMGGALYQSYTAEDKAYRSYMNSTALCFRLMREYYDGTYDDDTKRPHAAIKLFDIPKGTYKFSIENERSSAGAATKIYFGKAPVSMPDSMLTLRDSYEFVGWHDSFNTHDGSEEFPAETFEIVVPETGDYFVLFVADPDSWELIQTDKNRQFLMLTKIDLTLIPPLAGAAINLESPSVAVPRTTTADVTPLDENGIPFIGDYSVEFESSNTDVATIDKLTGLITPKEPGETYIKAYVTASTDSNVVDADPVKLTVTPSPELERIDSITAGGSQHIRLTTKDVQDTVPLYVNAINNAAEEMDMSALNITATALTPEIAVIDAQNNITPIKEGEAQFEVTVSCGNTTLPSQNVTLTVAYAKEKSTYMTKEKALIARENAQKYSWAKETVKNYVDKAKKWKGLLDVIYDSVVSEGLPRNITVGHKSEIYAYYCRYCGCDIRSKYGAYSWNLSPITRPWKIQCPDCKRIFPSNDFEEFYKLGLNEYGEFDRLRALEAHREKFADKAKTPSEPGEEYSASWLAYYGYGKGYLKNDIYPELYKSGESCGADPFFKNADLNNDGQPDNVEVPIFGGYDDVESGMLWGVDDGFGYVPLNEEGKPRHSVDAQGAPYKDDYGNVIIERHSYIAFYVHAAIWYNFTTGVGGVLKDAIEESANAYFYTGEAKYGYVAAILLDRVADVYPDLDSSLYSQLLGTVEGKMVDRVWSTRKTTDLIRAYDMVFDLYDDPYVVNYLNNKSKTLKMRYSKKTGDQIRTHIEDGIVRCAFESVKKRMLNGNFGMEQYTTAAAAVVLDSMPETSDWLDYLMQAGWNYDTGVSLGGGINENLIGKIDSDGQPTEGSEYNPKWLRNLLDVNDVLSGYDRCESANLFNNPKFVQMYYAFHPMIAGNYTPQIGDSGSTLSLGHWVEEDALINGWKNLKDPVFAQILYFLNGNSSEGLKYSITDKNPESLADEVQNVINTYGEYEFPSDIMTNFGFAILNDGKDFTSNVNSTSKDTRRNTWMYFGANAGHAHFDSLNLGMTAFGLNFMPDHGYPEQTGDQPNRREWNEVTFSHNTVTVNNLNQLSNLETRGKPKHFDDDGTVALMDVSSHASYPTTTSEYRRSVVQIHVDDENSYVVDFFRVIGGESHTYSFHASSNEISETAGLDLDPQDSTPGDFVLDDGGYLGTYAGTDVPYGDAPTGVADGHSWVKNIDRDNDPDDKFEVDFVIKDFNKAINDSSGLHLRMTLFNSGNIKNGDDADLAIGDGLPPQKNVNKNIDKFKYVLLENTGDNLDSTFMTVFEPYRDNRFIESVDELELTIDDAGVPKNNDAARALKITHVGGKRVDYVFYSTNNTVTYEITDGGDPIKFRGFVGVYTVNDGKNIYSYLHDGDILGSPIENAKSAIEAEVVSFTKDLLIENEIIIKPKNGTLSYDECKSLLPGRILVVDNGAETRSGAFKIIDASPVENSDNIRIDIGKVTTIRNYVDPFNTDFDPSSPDATYIYLLDEGQDARIPLTVSNNGAPEFDTVNGNLATSAGSSFAVTVHATSPITENPPSIEYIGTTLPRGANLDKTSGKITWKPSSSQIGDNHFAVTAHDADGRENTLHFTVTVYGSTTGKPSQDSGNTGSNESDGTTDTPAGGGGGGGGGASTPSTPSTSDKEDTTKPSTSETPSVDESERFVDLGAHAWAKEAINALADEGIIRGTSENTFSPVANITRADFALLLVRAFKLESENTENFADVEESDYFARELAIARNTGLVGGIGNNKYAPRNNITRQDMMVIVYRALVAMEKISASENAPAAADFDNVADYAKEAVSALVGAGLVNGKKGKIDPVAYTTRAEVAVLIKRVLDYIK